MNNQEKEQSVSGRQSLLILCRFLAVCISYRMMLFLLSGTGLLLTLLRRTQFAPYGIALFCLLLPSFLNDSIKTNAKKENSDIPLSSLYKRFRYSPVSFTTYRISLLLGMLLLLVWHKVQSIPLTLFGISVPLLYLALFLALYPVLSRVLFLIFHRRLMNGFF